MPIYPFFAYDPLHESCRERMLRVPFGDGVAIPALSAEDLLEPKDGRLARFEAMLLAEEGA